MYPQNYKFIFPPLAIWPSALSFCAFCMLSFLQAFERCFTFLLSILLSSAAERHGYPCMIQIHFLSVLMLLTSFIEREGNLFCSGRELKIPSHSEPRVTRSSDLEAMSSDSRDLLPQLLQSPAISADWHKSSPGIEDYSNLRACSGQMKRLGGDLMTGEKEKWTIADRIRWVLHFARKRGLGEGE